MLTVVELNQIEQLYKKYGSIKQVSRELGISRNTVRKYLRNIDAAQEGSLLEIYPENREINRPKSVVNDELIQLVHNYLQDNLNKPRKQRLSAAEIHRLAQGRGFQVGYTTIKSLVRDWNESHRSREVFVLQDPPEGYRAEFDWGYVDLTLGNIVQKVSLAIFTINYSQYRFGRLFLNQTSFDVIQAHIEFFNEIQGIPEIIIYDNVLTVYDYHRKIYQDSFIRFAVHYGFSYDVCNVRSPNEKGTDEESVGYIRSQAFSERTSFESFSEAQDWLIESLRRINQNHVYRRELPPEEGLVREQEKMKPLPSLEYSNYFTRSAKISKYSLVVFEGNYYSVPDTFRSRSITLKIFADRIDLTDGSVAIASHQRLYGKGNYSLDITHYLKTFEKKPGALRHSKVLGQLNEKIQNLYKEYYLDSPLEFIEILYLIQTTSPEGLISAIDHLTENGIVPGYDTLRLFLFQNLNPMIEPLEIIDPVTVTEPDLTIYDQMMRCEA